MPIPVALQFRSFRSRLVTFLVVLLLLVLGAMYLAVDRSTYANTRAAIDESLRVSRQTFRQLITERADNFRVASRLLVSDFAFRSAYRKALEIGSLATLRDMSASYQGRFGNADLMMFIDYDFQVQADNRDVMEPGSRIPWDHLIDDLSRESNEQAEAESFVLVQGAPYQVGVVPIFLPLLEGWILVGRELGDRFLEEIKTATGSELSIVEVREGVSPRTMASTLPDAAAGASGAAADPRAQLAAAFDPASIGSDATRLMSVGGEDYVSLAYPLVRRDGLMLVALIQRSLDQALAPYRALERALLTLFILALAVSAALALWLAGSVASPILALASRVKRIERGDFTTQTPPPRRDEVGQLADSVNTMAAGLAEREKVRDLLGKVVSKEIAEELMNKDIRLGGETRVVTVLFADIRNFTPLCEAREPEAVLTLLNEYLSRISGVIEARRGVVDKYVGDAVMALFGAPLARPDDPRQAMHTALDIAAALAELNRAHRAAGQPVLEAGIGLHTGPVVAGNLGSANRMNYTVIGDAVNLAARVEGLTRQYGVQTIVSDDSRQAAPGFIYRELDAVRVKGRRQPVRIFELVGREGEVDAAVLDEVGRFEQFLRHYRGREWQRADGVLRELLARHPDSQLYQLYRQRVQELRANPPEETWDGVS